MQNNVSVDYIETLQPTENDTYNFEMLPKNIAFCIHIRSTIYCISWYSQQKCDTFCRKKITLLTIFYIGIHIH